MTATEMMTTNILTAGPAINPADPPTVVERPLRSNSLKLDAGW